MNSICKDFKCPYFSEGNKVDGVTYGYGCKKFTVSHHCLVNEVKDVQANQYELFHDSGKMNGNKRNLIRMAIADMVSKDQSTHTFEEV